MGKEAVEDRFWTRATVAVRKNASNGRFTLYREHHGSADFIDPDTLSLSPYGDQLWPRYRMIRCGRYVDQTICDGLSKANRFHPDPGANPADRRSVPARPQRLKAADRCERAGAQDPAAHHRGDHIAPGRCELVQGCGQNVGKSSMCWECGSTEVPFLSGS